MHLEGGQIVQLKDNTKMSTKKYRSTEFLRIATFDEGKFEADQTQVVNTRYVKHVYQSTLSPRKLYGVVFKDFTGLTTYGSATSEDLAACGIPLPDCLGYQIELDPKRFGIVSGDQ
jgi:hypothetical protein